MNEGMKPSINKHKSSGTQLFETVQKLDNKDIIGIGTEKIVYQHPEDSNKAIRKYINKKASSPERLKSDFYLSKILHLLYPKNFPDIYMSLPSHKIDIVENVKKDFLANLALQPILSLKTRYIAHKLGVDIDTSGPDNFIVNSKLNAKYVDTPIGVNAEKIKKEIEKKLQGEDREKALQYLENYQKMKVDSNF